MPPVERFVCRFAAEPPQEALPHGAWAQTLQAEFLAACLRIDAEGEELGEAGELRWFPDRTWNGRTYVPVDGAHDDRPRAVRLRLLRPATRTDGRAEPSDFDSTRRLHRRDRRAQPGLAASTSARRCRQLARRGRPQRRHDARLGRAADRRARASPPPSSPASRSTSARSPTDRFTLIAPDDYRSDFLDVKLWDGDGRELASESLYVEDDDEEE